MTSQQHADAMDALIVTWYEQHRQKNGQVFTNVMVVPLILLQKMREGFKLSHESEYLTSSQVRGLSASAVEKILKEHSVDRAFTAEGGRTSRKTTDHARNLAAILNTPEIAGVLDSVSSDDRAAILFELQRRAVMRLKTDFFDRMRLEVDINIRQDTRTIVKSILSTANAAGGNTGGAVAQHLIGALLELRFPTLQIENHSYTTADKQTARSGDFVIGDTAIHVTMSPSDGLINKRCNANVIGRVRPLVLVPEDKTAAARQMVEMSQNPNEIGVEPLEGFIATSLEEMAEFSVEGIENQLAALVFVYNARVSQVEADQSLQIRAPALSTEPLFDA